MNPKIIVPGAHSQYVVWNVNTYGCMLYTKEFTLVSLISEVNGILILLLKNFSFLLLLVLKKSNNSYFQPLVCDMFFLLFLKIVSSLIQKAHLLEPCLG